MPIGLVRIHVRGLTVITQSVPSVFPQPLRLLKLTQARARRSIRNRLDLLATASSTVEEGEFSSTQHDLASCRARLDLLASASSTVEEGEFSSTQHDLASS